MKLNKKQKAFLKDYSRHYFGITFTPNGLLVTKEILEGLLSLKSYDLESLKSVNFEGKVGICWHTIFTLPRGLRAMWSGFSGNQTYPIKAPARYRKKHPSNVPDENLAQDVYDDTGNKYTGDYGRSRLRYARYTLACVEYLLELVEADKKA